MANADQTPPVRWGGWKSCRFGWQAWLRAVRSRADNTQVLVLPAIHGVRGPRRGRPSGGSERAQMGWMNFEHHGGAAINTSPSLRSEV